MGRPLTESNPAALRLPAPRRQPPADAARLVEQRHADPRIAKAGRAGDAGDAGPDDGDAGHVRLRRDARPAAGCTGGRADWRLWPSCNRRRFLSKLYVIRTAGLHEAPELSQHVPWGTSWESRS